MSHTRRTALPLFLVLSLIHLPATAVPKRTTTSDGRAVELRLRNNTPFIMLIYISGIRVGWIKPFRTERLRGLKRGYHTIYAHSEYGSATWGPRRAYVPGTLNLEVDSSEQPPDMATALASKVYQLNRSSLLACDKLAERRGEVLRGIRTELECKVDGNGKGEVTITAGEMDARLLSCYRAVVKQWTFPATGSPYAVSFSHGY